MRKKNQRPLIIAALEQGSLELVALLFEELLKRIGESSIAALIQEALSLENIQLRLQQELQSLGQILFNKLNENSLLSEQLTELQDSQRGLRSQNSQHSQHSQHITKIEQDCCSNKFSMFSVEIIDSFFQAIAQGDISAVKTLLDDFPSILFELQDGLTALMSAASLGSIALIQLLLERDKSQRLLFKVTSEGWNTAHFAVFDGTLETLLALLKFDAEKRLLLGRIHETGYNVLHLAMERGKLDIVSYLLEHEEVGQILRFSCTEMGENVVEIACKYEFFDFAVTLLKKYPNEFLTCVNAGRTLLMNQKLIKQLVRDEKCLKDQKASIKNKSIKFHEVPKLVETSSASKLLTYLLNDFTIVLRSDHHGNNVFTANFNYLRKKFSEAKEDLNSLYPKVIIKYYSYIYETLVEILEKPNFSYLSSKIRKLKLTIALFDEMLADFRAMIQEREEETAKIQAQIKAIKSELDNIAMPPPRARPRKRGADALIFSDAEQGAAAAQRETLSIATDLSCTAFLEVEEPTHKKQKSMKMKDFIKFV